MRRINILILILLLSLSCKSYIPRNDYNFKNFNCLAIDDLELPKKQIRQLKNGVNEVFNLKIDLGKFCYQYKVKERQLGFVEAFNFSSHQSNFYFIIGSRNVVVLQTENEEVSLVDSFRNNKYKFSNDFSKESLEKMHDIILSN